MTSEEDFQRALNNEEPVDCPNTFRVYAWAAGGTTPPLLMNPERTWKMKTFSRVAISSLGVKPSGAMTATNERTGQVIEPATPLSEVDLLPYDMIRFDVTPV